MTSIKIKLTGILLALLGAMSLAFGYLQEGSAFGDFPVLIGYGCLVVGGGLFVIGVFLSGIDQMRPTGGLHSDDGGVAALAVIRCMIAVSVADGHLDDREVAMIGRIYRQLTGSEVAEDTIRETAEDMLGRAVDLRAELENVRGSLPTDLKEKILKAALYILAADGHVDDGEEETLETVRAGLGISSGRYKAIHVAFMNKKKS